jgi:hypothetical protein
MPLDIAEVEQIGCKENDESEQGQVDDGVKQDLVEVLIRKSEGKDQQE